MDLVLEDRLVNFPGRGSTACPSWVSGLCDLAYSLIAL